MGPNEESPSASSSPSKPPLLGFLECRIKDELAEQEPHKLSKVGGQPIFPSTVDQEEVAQLQTQLNCHRCAGRLLFVGQIFCPLILDELGRVLYFFACDRLPCSSDCWIALRCVFKEEAKQSMNSQGNEPAQTSNTFEEQSWGEEEEEEQEFSTSHDKSISQEDDTHANECRMSSQTTHKKRVFQTLEQFAHNRLLSYYLEARHEEADEKLDQHIHELLRQYNDKTREHGERREEAGGMSGQDFSVYDETNLLENYNNDVTTYKFYKRLALCPSQVIRYAWNEQPLVNVSDFSLPQSHCNDCGARRVFELQLMPGLIHFLRFESQDDDSKKKTNSVNLQHRATNLDFASVLVYTCSANCNAKSLHFECCSVLKETDLHLLEEFGK